MIAQADERDEAGMLARTRFLESHFRLVCDALKVAPEDSVVVLADKEDDSGATFIDQIGRYADDVCENDAAWVGHFRRRLLAAMLFVAWPDLKNVIAALRSDEYGERDWVLAISCDGAQLRGGTPEVTL